jgi:hypothetical protein
MVSPLLERVEINKGDAEFNEKATIALLKVVNVKPCETTLSCARGIEDAAYFEQERNPMNSLFWMAGKRRRAGNQVQLSTRNEIFTMERYSTILSFFTFAVHCFR